MYYLIENEYVGPNKRDSHGIWIGDSRIMSICTKPGKTNMSGEERTDGWLGTTNDNSETAHGEFETIEAARSAAHKMGFVKTYESESEYAAYEDEEYGIVEQWISEDAARAQWDAGDWFINGLGRAGTCSEYGITANTTDEELNEMVERAEREANENDAELHGTLELFTELRDDLKSEAEDTDES
jgi:hypothetical protein